jgi:hypothetical protein
MSIVATKIQKLLTDAKYYLVNKSYNLLLEQYNSSYICEKDSDNEHNLQYVRLLIKSLNIEYNIDPTSIITNSLYLKLSKLINIIYLNQYSIDTSLIVNNNTLLINVINSIQSKWGFIQGNIQSQTDLILLLSTKADIGDGLLTPINSNIVNNNLIVSAKIGNQIKWKIGTQVITVLSPQTLTITPASNNFFRKDLVLLSLTGINILQGVENQNLPTIPNNPVNTISLLTIDVYGSIINSNPPQPPVDISAPSWTVYGSNPFGKYTNGQTVPMAISAYQQYKEAWTNIAPPNYLAPILNLSSTPSNQSLEVGQTLNLVLSLNFIQNNAGSETANTRIIKKNNINLAAFTDTLIVSTNNVAYQGFTSFGQGSVLNNQAGIPDPTGRINAGSTNTGIINYIGSYFNFYGVGIITTTSTQVRTLLKTISNTFSLVLPSGTTQASFAYLATKSDILDSSVKYVEGFNSNVGNTFTKSLFNVNDAGGNPVAYKIYTVTLPAVETSTVTYNVTLV